MRVIAHQSLNFMRFTPASAESGTNSGTGGQSRPGARIVQIGFGSNSEGLPTGR